jgi:hypothetical protein
MEETLADHALVLEANEQAHGAELEEHKEAMQEKEKEHTRNMEREAKVSLVRQLDATIDLL